MQPKKDLRPLLQELASYVDLPASVIDPALEIWKKVVEREDYFNVTANVKKGMKSFPARAKEFCVQMGLDEEQSLSAVTIASYILSIARKESMRLSGGDHSRRTKSYYWRFRVRKRLVPGKEIRRSAGILSLALALGIAYATNTSLSSAPASRSSVGVG